MVKLMQKFSCQVPIAAKFLGVIIALILVAYAAGRSTKERPAGSPMQLPDIQSSNPVLFAPDVVVKTATTTASVNGYTIELVRQTSNEDTMNTRLRIFKQSQVVFEATDGRFTTIAQLSANEKGEEIKDASDVADAVRDITGNGVPELALLGFSNGAHCCFTIHIIELGDTFSVLLSRPLGDDVKLAFIDVTGDGVMEIQTTDDAFDYWHTGHAGSPLPQVWLRFDDQKRAYVFAPELMKNPPPTKTVLITHADFWKKISWDGSGGNPIPLPAGVSPQLFTTPWGYAVELIYTGNAAAAREYIDLAWRENKEFASKEIFWNEFKKELQTSRFYGELSPEFIDFSKLP